MTAMFLQNVAEIAARLATIPDVAELEIMPAGDPVSFRALHLYYDGHDPADEEAGATHYAANIEIVGYVEHIDGAQAFADLSDLYVQVVNRLLPEPPLGGLAETIDEGSFRIQAAPLADIRRLSFTLALKLGFAATRGDPAQPA